MQYVIDYAGSYEGTFAATRSPVRETLYTTRNAALKDLAMVIPGDTEAILKDMVTVKGEEGWYVYLNQEDADAEARKRSTMARSSKRSRTNWSNSGMPSAWTIPPGPPDREGTLWVQPQ